MEDQQITTVDLKKCSNIIQQDDNNKKSETDITNKTNNEILQHHDVDHYDENYDNKKLQQQQQQFVLIEKKSCDNYSVNDDQKSKNHNDILLNTITTTTTNTTTRTTTNDNATITNNTDDDDCLEFFMQKIDDLNKNDEKLTGSILQQHQQQQQQLQQQLTKSDLIHSSLPLTINVGVDDDDDNDDTENQFIQQVRMNCKEILSKIESIVNPSTSSSSIASIANAINENKMIETTRKESESFKQQLQQQNCNNTNNTNNINTNKNNNENNMKYEIKAKQQQQQQKITLPTQDTKIQISAVCNKNENNESKSECYNTYNKQVLFNNVNGDDDDDDDDYVDVDDVDHDNKDNTMDIDVITISSTDENPINSNTLINELKRIKKEIEQKEPKLKLTEKSLLNSMTLQRSHSKTESVLEYLNSVEPTVTEIQDKLIEFDNNLTLTNNNCDNTSSGDDGSTRILNESESEEDDQLKPLMQDNHTVIVNHEFYVYNNKYQNQNYNDIMSNKTLNNNNNNNNNNSYSSTDSDLSTQFDQRDLTAMSQNSSDDCNDSGLDTLSSQLQKPTIKISLKKFGPTPPAPSTTPVDGISSNNTNLNIIQQQQHQQLQQQQQQQQQQQSQSQSPQEEVREIDTLTPIEIPDDKLCEDIVEQVEYYFSNDSILKDAFLLKHVRRNKEGFVSLKLVSSFKRVRQFTKDWRVVGIAIERKSKKIELNDMGTKIRRLDALPNFDETMPSRTIVVCDLPYEKLSIDKITDIFSKCGEIALVRILKPGMQIPVDVRQFMNKYPEMQQKECALVEYIDSASARFAKSMEGNYKIFDMVAPKKKTGKKSITTITKFIENYKYPDVNYERTRGGIENAGHHHHYQNYNNGGHGHNINYTSNNNNINNQQQGHTNQCNLNHSHTHILQNNNSNNYDNEYRSKIRSNYDIRNTQHLQQQPQQQSQQNQESQLQNFVYQPPHMQQRRFSTSDQENQQNNRDHIQNMNNLNNNSNSNSNIHFSHYPPRRMSNSSINDIQSRKYSNCSEGYSSCSEYSRRPSLTSSSQDSGSRKTSTSCSEYCPCSRRTSNASDYYRKISQQSDQIVSSSPNRRFSNGSFHSFDRQYSNPNDSSIIHNNTMRRISFDSNYDRKISTSSINENNNNTINNNNNTNNNNNINNQHICENNHFRKYSNGFDPNRKLSFTDQYFNGRRISTDSGYDRKLSFSSDTGSTSTSPRSRANSFIITNQHKPADILVRTPIGPDGNTKGFTQRARKVGQLAGQ